MGTECDYSFYDLFAAAYRRQPTIEEIAHFTNLSQEKKNILIKTWAQEAAWETDDRLAADGQIYTAFAPTFNPDEDPNDISKYIKTMND